MSTELENRLSSYADGPGPDLWSEINKRSDRPVVIGAAANGRRRLFGWVAAAAILIGGIVGVAVQRGDGAATDNSPSPGATQPRLPAPPPPVEPGEVLPSPQPAPPASVAATTAAIGTLTIDPLGLVANIIDGATQENGRTGPVHFSSTARPGQSGNTVVFGHRTIYGTPFLDLDTLSIGDEIEIVSELGLATYRVTQAPLIVAPTAIEYFDQAGPDRLTLVTNHPKFSARQRLVVVAELTSDPFDTERLAAVILPTTLGLPLPNPTATQNPAPVPLPTQPGVENSPVPLPQPIPPAATNPPVPMPQPAPPQPSPPIDVQPYFAWPFVGTVDTGFGPQADAADEVHSGIDMPARPGTFVFASASGTVIGVGVEDEYSNSVIIDHGNGYRTLYAQLDSSTVEVGATVSTGDQVGSVGVGHVAAAFGLHFEIWIDDVPVDPIPLLPPNPHPAAAAPPAPAPQPAPPSAPAPVPLPVPDVVGLLRPHAIEALQQLGFSVVLQVEENDGDGPSGRIYRQEPSGGSLLEPGSTVTIWQQP